MDFSKLEEKEVYEVLNTSSEGLDKTEAGHRLSKYGLNELKEGRKVRPFRIFLRQFKEFIIWILLAASLLSFLVHYYIDAYVILGIVILNSILGFVQEYRAEREMLALKKLETLHCIVIRNGKKKNILAKELVPGDLITLEPGNKIPADCKIIKTIGLKIDESILTGESVPVPKTKKSNESLIYSGTVVTEGRGRAVVINTGMKTKIGDIASMVQKIKSERKLTPLQKRLNKLGLNLGIISIAAGFITLFVGLVSGIKLIEISLSAVALAVAAIPEGLPAILTITLAIGLRRMAKENVLIRKLHAVETLGSTTVICVDKTGTITHNEMTVKEIYSNEELVNISGEGYDLKGNFSVKNKKIDPNKLKQILKIGKMCNNATLVDGNTIGDPTEIALLVVAEKAELQEDYERIDEVPFDAVKKFMITTHKIGKKKVDYIKGAPEVILKKCSYIQKDGRIVWLTNKEKIKEINDEMTSRGLRVLGLAYKEKDKIIFAGLVGMMDPVRKEVKKSVQLCEKAGIKTIMITGDYSLTAKAIAEKIGLKGDLLTGVELDKLNNYDLEKKVENIAVYARVTPEHKVRILDALKKRGHVVAMSGDGVNDAPALEKADIGIAIGSGTDVAKEASDMILLDDDYSSVVNAVKQGRGIYDNIRKFVKFLLCTNFGEVALVLITILFGFPLPLLAVQILWINLISDGLPALALGVDPIPSSVMNRKPREKKDGILKGMLGMIIIAGLLAAFVSFGLFLFEFFGTGDLVKARTIALTMIIMFEMFFIFGCRSEKVSIFKMKHNKFLIGAVIISILLHLSILYVPFLQGLFRTVGLGLNDWLLIIPLSLVGLVYTELRKIRLNHAGTQ